jgi:hypothetical protein
MAARDGKQMSEQFTDEELVVLKYIREKTKDNESHRFYPNDVVTDSKTIHDLDPIFIRLERKKYIRGRLQIDTSVKDPSKHEYMYIKIEPEGFLLLGEDVYSRLGVTIDANTQRPVQ